MLRRLGLARSGVAFFLLLTVLLAACEIPGRPTEICDLPYLPQIHSEYPPAISWMVRGGTIIDDLRPTIIWSLEDGATCVPGQYKIEIWSVYNYLPGASAGWLIVSGRSDVEIFPWPADAPDLQPGHSYMANIVPLGLSEGELREYGFYMWEFTVGPVCHGVSRLDPPNLHWPPDNWTVDPTGMYMFEWSNNLTCWPENGYSIEISAEDDFSDLVYEWSSIQAESTTIHPMMDIPWEDCGRYYWRVRPDISDTITGPYSETRSFVIRPGGVICPLDLSRPVIPPEDRIPPEAILRAAANCRSGPTTEYDVRSVLPQGGEYEIQARDRAETSWLVLDPAIGGNCWVYGELVEVVGDTSLVGVMDPDPPPSASHQVNCSQYNQDYQACDTNPACRWDPNGSPTSPCVNK